MGSVEEVPSDVEPPKGELITKALRGGANTSRAMPAVAADAELLDEELPEELVPVAGSDNVRSTALAVDSIPDALPDFLPVLVLEDIALISIAFCLL